MSRLPGVGPRTRRTIYGEPRPEQVRDELHPISTVDLAHLVMLAEQGLIDRPAASRLAARIRRLRADGFADLHGVAAPRGLYLAYESLLIADLGADTGGRLHTGRSRNDIKATTTAMAVRAALAELLGELLRLQAVVLNRALAHRSAVMAIHTHFQPAMPVTYGYYLAGIAEALDRDATGLAQALDGLGTCPLGAGAVAGTDLPIDPARTAALLGFAGPPAHATDSVASRDGVLRALAAAATTAVTLSRLGTDLQLWSTQEYGFLTFPDRLVGSSSAMPQKRNAFLLEHLKAAPGPVVGAWTAAATTMASTPFTNSIEVGTVAIRGVGAALAGVTDAVTLAQVLVSGARPECARMRRHAEEGFVTATVVANRLVRAGMPFRSAHELVGDAVRDAVAVGSTNLAAVAEHGDVVLPPIDALVAEQDRGGGPGAVDAALTRARERLADRWTGVARWRSARRAAAVELERTVDALVRTGDA